MKKGTYNQLNLSHLQTALPQVLERARTEQWTYERFLEQALAAELDGREQKAIARRLKAARIPSKKTLDGFDFSFQPTLSERVVREPQTVVEERAPVRQTVVHDDPVGNAYAASQLIGTIVWAIVVLVLLIVALWALHVYAGLF